MKTDKKGEFLKDWIERKLSRYDWFKGVKYVDIEPYSFKLKELPDYVFYLDTGGYTPSIEFADDFDFVFRMFFSRDKNDDPTAVWEFRYV